ncbi:DUF6491 family protein [Sphingomonas sp.]|uniref:DUF6491 family protein n=1 Tax=Sphingomonas sp. TaxID=28214 RepID=UPI002BC996AC|nr:DUF6491 family protein [Sphingomonas sp.]HWK34872.1 DUF6491 family protein [Sphingomonas sp.]
MNRTLIALAALAASVVPAAAQEQPAPPTGAQASIPFVQFGNIWNFEADGDRGIYLQNRARQWYYAEFNGPCINLPTAIRLTVSTRFAGDRLDSTGRIYVDGEPCWIASLVKSDAPPRKARRKG